MIDLLDVRYAARVLWRSPAFTIPAVLTLALGIGAATSVFTVVQRVLLQPLPYGAPEQLVRLWDRNDEAGLSRFSVSPANYFAWRSRATSLQTLGAYREDGLTVSIDGASERVDVTKMRLAPYRSASASTASPAGVPNMMRSCAVTLKVAALRPAAVVSLMVHSGESVC